MANWNGLRIGSTQFGLPSNTPAFSSHILDAATDGVGWIFQAQDDANDISHLAFRVGARAGTPPTYVIALEAVDPATGNPDGTVLGGGTPASKTFTPPASTAWDGTWQYVALDNAYTPSRGQILAYTVRHSSGTIDGSNNISISTDVSNLAGATNYANPAAMRLTAGTWAARGQMPLWGVRAANGRYGNPCVSFFSTASAATAGHRQACKFTIPTGSCSSFKVRGFRFSGRLSATSSGNPIAGLWSSAGVIQNVTLDTDVWKSPAFDYELHEVLFDEATLTALTPGTAYYIGLEVVTETVILNGIQIDSSSAEAFSGGPDWMLSSFDGSIWTDSAAVRPFLELLVDDVTATGGAGAVIGASGLVIRGAA